MDCGHRVLRWIGLTASPVSIAEDSSYFLFKHRNALVHIVEILCMAAKHFRDFRELPLLSRKLLLDEKILMFPLFVPSVRPSILVST